MGVRKYFAVWDVYQEVSHPQAVRGTMPVWIGLTEYSFDGPDPLPVQSLKEAQSLTETSLKSEISAKKGLTEEFLASVSISLKTLVPSEFVDEEQYNRERHKAKMTKVFEMIREM